MDNSQILLNGQSKYNNEKENANINVMNSPISINQVNSLLNAPSIQNQPLIVDKVMKKSSNITVSRYYKNSGKFKGQPANISHNNEKEFIKFGKKEVKKNSEEYKKLRDQNKIAVRDWRKKQKKKYAQLEENLKIIKKFLESNSIKIPENIQKILTDIA
jgi:hypothetical protein